jgi:hypothetical protein
VIAGPFFKFSDSKALKRTMKLSLSLLVTFPSVLAATAANDDNPCRLYLAKSVLSTTDAPVFGLYSGVTVAKNETIGIPDIALPFIDFVNGPFAARYADTLKSLEPSMWTAEYAGAKFEGNHSSTILVPGLGVMAHYHKAYFNIDWLQASTLLRDAPAFFKAGQPHPARGAISPYYNLTMRATDPIPAGMELFANFGDLWDDYKLDLYEQTISRWDYLEADKIVDRIVGFLDKHPELSEETIADTIDFIIDKVLGPHQGIRVKSIRSLIPQTAKRIRKAKEMGGTFKFRHQDMIKSLDWLNTYGTCVDSMEVKTSTIPDAGRGAFATRDFKEGTRLTISPMLLIPDDTLMEMYEIKQTKRKVNGKKVKRQEFDFNKPIGKQVVLNYAFGHPESSMLLLPLAPVMSFINHASENASNVYVDWSNHPHLMSKEDIGDETVDDLEERIGAGQPTILFQVVALKDIKKGDELLLDYGVEWEFAWDAWKKEFDTMYQDSTWPLHAEDVHAEYKIKPYPTDLKVGRIPYPKGVVTSCFLAAPEPAPDGMPKENDKGEDILVWTGPTTYENYTGVDLVVCDLLSREVSKEHSYTYTVKARTKETNEIAQVMGVPHAAIRLTDRPYTSDLHTKNAFRHFIGFDDLRWPQKWRDLRKYK